MVICAEASLWERMRAPTKPPPLGDDDDVLLLLLLPLLLPPTVGDEAVVDGVEPICRNRGLDGGLCEWRSRKINKRTSSVRFFN